ncbi:Crp/Fnr family transcriptional regulator [[Phormidium ambiguum] IAM M-71]|uniref:Crp/Fnr family transcriptional regulator n=1 Tax=[Phormidium ambiguum] IAM M-71 TaxID=454136 RepID=A0A1U7I9R5_9CYAN|nr:Crp/Fnr family transcriptional regulator [Phormidium ambiguum IAM M-71]
MLFTLLSTKQSVKPIRQGFSPRSILPLKSNLLWKIESGIVKATTWLDDDTTVTLGIWGPGDIVGKPLSKVEAYQIECLTKVEVSVFNVQEWQQITDVLMAHIQQTEELLLIRSYKKTEIMVIKLLSWLAKRFGHEVKNGHLIDVRLTHQDIAEMLGATRVTVTRVLIQLEQQGLIERLSLHRFLVKEEELWHYEI